MNEEALNDAWNLSLAKGFKGSKEDFTKLLQSYYNPIVIFSIYPLRHLKRKILTVMKKHILIY
jgi:hypothetical protein